ncbi:hypothetical protein C0Q70_10795 [Pomacea canaliculata]|uniref:Uncharacterized protein n=2 Tax=Pomacea canaliculata TaxID=400727 RepID=A0A2T7P471_POMCA|nr:uncharacterized protein LOC112567023 isoform X2 [Pomacea canaliculata]XP_025099244.1 uncharacterized protein LOC112567023 isoform X2 [Pomacea canaliculata]PVD28208.1 hypothetical protein C0Q70_10795 [Pomacea canaliculata]
MNLQTTSMTCSKPTCPPSSAQQGRSLEQQGRSLEQQAHPLSADTVYKMAESVRLRSASLSRRCAVQQLLQPDSRTLRPSPVMHQCSDMRPTSQPVRHHSAMLSPCSARELPLHVHTSHRRLERPLTAAASGPLEGPAVGDHREDFCAGGVSRVAISPGYVRRVEITARGVPRLDLSNCDDSCCLDLCSQKPEPSDQRSNTSENPSRSSVAHHFREVLGGARAWQEGSETCSPGRGQGPELSSFLSLDLREKSFLASTSTSLLAPGVTHVPVRHTFTRGEMTSSGAIVARQEPTVIDNEFNSASNDCREERAAPSVGEQDASMPGGECLEVNSDDRSSDKGNNPDLASSYGQSGGIIRSEGASKMASTSPDIVVLRGEPSTPLFFCSLKHMNSKIYLGRATRSLASSKVGERRLTSRTTAGDVLFPAFVSPRKSKLVQKPHCKGFFGPPLLAKDRQIANPSFFAGSDLPYSLPERLPDVLEFTDRATRVTDPTPTFFRSSSGFFTPRGTTGTRPVAM